MKFTAAQIAEIIGGNVIGNPKVVIHKLSKIEEGVKGSLTFLANPKYHPHLYSTNASVVLVGKHVKVEGGLKPTLIQVDDAYQAFSKLLQYYNAIKTAKTGIENPVFIAPSAKYGEGVYIGAFAYMGENVVVGNHVKIYPNTYIGDNVTIGDHVTLFSGVKIYSECRIGNNCTIHSGAVIGSDGFGFVPNENGHYQKIPQTGHVIIEDDVDVGAGTTIDRATLGATIIRRGVKLDNLIQIAHNVEIGEHTVIAAQTGIAGSTKIGKNCMIGGQVGIVGHVTIGDRAKIQAQSGVTQNVKDGEVIQGAPAFDYTSFNKSYVYFKRFPELANMLHQLEKKINSHEP